MKLFVIIGVTFAYTLTYITGAEIAIFVAIVCWRSSESGTGAQLESRLPINGAHNQYDWSCGGDKIEHIHQALVRLMAVNMFRFCDKSGYQTIYAAVERERN